MRAIIVPLAVAGMLLGLLAAGCGAPSEPVPEPPSPSATAVQTAPPEPTDTPPPPPPTPTEVVLADATNCITCHTNQETLQALAEEPEEQESHSEGEG